MVLDESVNLKDVEADRIWWTFQNRTKSANIIALNRILALISSKRPLLLYS